MVGDDMFATEGDSANVGRQGTATRENGRVGRRAPVAADTAAGDPASGDVSVDVLWRLRERVDRNVRLVDRMRADPLAPEPPGLPELIDTARRMRHDAETLLLLAGVDTGARPGAPVRLSALLDEAVDATDEPMRVDVRSGPSATVEPAAATELLHVVAEAVDHVTAIHPGARVEVSHRTESPGGVVVEIRTASSTRYDPGGKRGMAVAALIAQRSRSGLVLRTPLPGPAGPGAAIVTIHCPARAVSVQELEYAPWPEPPARPSGELDRSFGSSEYAGGSNGYAAAHDAETPAHGLPVDPLGHRPSPRPTVETLFSELSADRSYGDYPGSTTSESRTANGRSHPGTDPVDELFGPLVDLPAGSESQSVATPIFEAVASAWFRDDVPQAAATDWESPGDREWRAAAERAARTEDTTFTAEGLPRRRPGGRLVAPRLQDGSGEGAHAQPATPADRVPDRVRERLATYQRGLRQGRHRAEPADPGDPAAW